MSKRIEYFVCRSYVKWKGHMYHKGDVFPPNFTHHDKARSIYNSRIGERVVEDAEVVQNTEKVAEKVIEAAKEEITSPKSVSPLSGNSAKPALSFKNSDAANHMVRPTTK